jgi:formate hydrogenlyase transcriptional activator
MVLKRHGEHPQTVILKIPSSCCFSYEYSIVSLTIDIPSTHSSPLFSDSPSAGRSKLKGSNVAAPDRINGLEIDAAQLRFEMLLTDIATRFLGTNPQDIDTEIDSALRKIRQFFDSNICGLFRISPEAGEVFLSHVQVTEDIPVMPGKINYAPTNPWRFSRLVRGEIILVNSLDELPEQAKMDRLSAESLGIQALLMIPVQIGETTRHALYLGFTRPGPAWLAEYVPRLQVFAKFLATALDRSRAIMALQEAEIRLGLAAELAGAGLWDLDMGTNIFWGTARARELYGVDPDQSISLEELFNIVHPGDLARLKREVKNASDSGISVRTEHRIVLPDGEIRWLAVQGARSPESFGGGNHLLGVSIDVTERKDAEEAAMRFHEEIKRLKEMLEDETRYLRKEISLSQSHVEIIGKSHAIRSVLQKVEQVAATDATVLITGETGTGKELVARAIHGSSKRNDRLMVKVDCASLPSTLIESELFGRERGAYTGAMTKQIGRFQLADKGTIFLDEIGELAKETQAKLLGVLQEGCFEALGSPKTVKVNVRVIAATNRDLAKEVKEGRFREDLYYRLKVFPIEVPPLRDRKEDIPMLVWNFVERFSKEMRKDIRRIPKETMDALVLYHWPGNIRELKNLIEQAFIISPEDVLTVRLPESAIGHSVPPRTLEGVERQHVLAVLEQTDWRIKGDGGAATWLGVNPSSLYSKMKKLGISAKRKRTI